MSGKPDDARLIAQIVDYLNEMTGGHYKANSKKTARHVRARIAEGYAFDDFKRVIDAKVAQWLNRPDMRVFLRPETLFGTKFEGYLNESAIRAKSVGQYDEYDDDSYTHPPEEAPSGGGGGDARPRSQGAPDAQGADSGGGQVPTCPRCGAVEGVQLAGSMFNCACGCAWPARKR